MIRVRPRGRQVAVPPAQVNLGVVETLGALTAVGGVLLIGLAVAAVALPVGMKMAAKAGAG